MTKDLGFDPAELEARYQEERAKRMRSDGNDQYVHMHGQFAHFIEDPYCERLERAPITEEVEVVVMGGGFGGLLAAARLKEAGIDDVRIIEKGGDFGGTWYWNRYPGAACDTESYIYLPLLEELDYMPREKYARRPEIFAHAQAIGRHYDLYSKAIFQTLITEFRWDEADGRWLVLTDRDDKIRARFVVMVPGHYQEPKLPGIRGIETFKGHSFHTSRWDYDYTGGDALGGLDKLGDKRVGIIGTGATAIQCVPHLAQAAKQLYVFQRTPSSVDLRGDTPTDPEWYNSFKPGWQKRRMMNFTGVFYGEVREDDQVNDGWTKAFIEMIRSTSPDMSPEERQRAMQLTDYKIMEGIRHRIDETIADKDTAEALKPWYNRVCKRPCFHDDYLISFNRPNVELVDTNGQGVERVTEHGIVAVGKEYEIDCLIYATGFDVSHAAGFPVPIIGRHGETLEARWKDGAVTMHGFHVHGFPNFFIMSTLQSGLDANFPNMLEEQSRHIAYILSEAKKRGITRIEVTEQAESDWVKVHEEHSHIPIGIWKDCTPSYFNNEGHASRQLARNGPFGLGPIMFSNILEEWREQGKLEGLALS